jgi:hypothetical protein
MDMAFVLRGPYDTLHLTVKYIKLDIALRRRLHIRHIRLPRPLLEKNCFS